jgi:hypothetical protein
MSELFEVLDPPPGGLDRLHARLAQRRRRQAGVAVGAGALALAAVAMFALRPAPSSTVDDPVWIALHGAEIAPVQGRDGSTAAPVMVDDALLFYRVVGPPPAPGEQPTAK